MTESLEFIPAFISPLTDKEHATIGRIALLWGQIEYLIDDLMCLVSGQSWDQLRENPEMVKHVSQKIRFLKKEAERRLEPAGTDMVLSFCAFVQDTKFARNDVFHGIWGWRADRRKRIVFPAARKSRAPWQPFPAAKLVSLEKKLCRCSRMGADLCQNLRKENVSYIYSRFIHHNEREPAPEWLRQWSDRYPLDIQLLGRTAEKGELPRLDKLFPDR